MEKDWMYRELHVHEVSWNEYGGKLKVKWENSRMDHLHGGKSHQMNIQKINEIMYGAGSA